jgi:hypothetical protein
MVGTWIFRGIHTFTEDMRTASIPEIKQELATLTHSELVTLCAQLARNKKENKEFINYWLFDKADQVTYMEGAKKEISSLMDPVNKTNLYAAKKTIRKVLRMTNKYIKFSGSPVAETELLIQFCRSLKNTGIPLEKSTAISNLYNQQIKKINQALSQLHEDLQYDYKRDLESLF